LDELTRKDEDFSVNFTGAEFDVDISTLYDSTSGVSNIDPELYSPLVNDNFSQSRSSFSQLQNNNFNSFASSQPHQHQTQSSITPDFIQRCQKQLASYIGPMASLIIEETLADNPGISPYQLVEYLSREISEPQAALEFTRTLFT
jgi:serine/threonine-protein kinase